MNEDAEYDALLTAAGEDPEEGTPLGALGDWLEEHGRPGAQLAREGAATGPTGSRTCTGTRTSTN